MFNLRKARGQTLGEKLVIEGAMVVVFVLAIVLIATGVDFVINNTTVAWVATVIVFIPISYFAWKFGMRAAQAKAVELDTQVKK
jgi:hypothetical protein